MWNKQLALVDWGWMGNHEVGGINVLCNIAKGFFFVFVLLNKHN